MQSATSVQSPPISTPSTDERTVGVFIAKPKEAVEKYKEGIYTKTVKAINQVFYAEDRVNRRKLEKGETLPNLTSIAVCKRGQLVQYCVRETLFKNISPDIDKEIAEHYFNTGENAGLYDKVAQEVFQRLAKDEKWSYLIGLMQGAENIHHSYRIPYDSKIFRDTSFTLFRNFACSH